MSQTLLVSNGYVRAPYLHNQESLDLKEAWIESKNIDSMYFVTATFSEDSKPYFSFAANHYLLAKYLDDNKIKQDLEKFNQSKTSFMFSTDEYLFEREANGEVNFVSVYYLEYGDSDEDIAEVATLLAKRDQVGKAIRGHMNIFCTQPSRFTFPYSKNIIVLEVASEKSHQSVNKYCEKTRRDVCRKGITMTNLFGLSLLERLK